ncbi:hypothetical protein BOTBODRAFT_36901 [Botryobasidium botryosum FD-172 SS1]|uniref:F-box domain-containing protein n=1 Tax=Botryobasidium botryosum (strain FD-172 SS1) TaxID=930990 RepID=A0A067M268_BOTB1|nr:hypothetical protein BOTBODRAFT_36901 [Botryobasidium botryosum FD-172 SS1]
MESNNFHPANLDKHLEGTSRPRDLHLPPTSDLPTEILILIFHYAERDTPAHLIDSTLHSLIRVSRRWKEIIMDTPSLWTTICDVPHADKLINRSGSLPLRILRTAKRGLGLSEYISLVSPHVERWDSCELRGLGSERQEILALLQTPAPALESLTISLYRGDGSSVLDCDQAFSSMIPFMDATPRLRELILNGVFVPWDSALLTNLTRLHLGYVEYYQSDLVWLLLGALRASPCLEYLCLESLDVAMWSESLNIIPLPVQLAHLQSLRMQQLQWLQHDILPYLTIPPSSQLELCVRVQRERDMPHPEYTYSPQPHPGLQNLVGITHLSIYVDEEMCYHTIGRSPESDAPPFIFEAQGMRDPLTYTLLTIQSAFPMSFETFVLSHINPQDNKARVHAITSLIEFIGGYPLIRMLEVDSCHPAVTDALLRALTSRLCPRLEELHISRCSIDGLGLVELVKAGFRADGAEECTSPSDTRCLRRVSLAGCLSISQETVSVLREYLAVEVEEDENIATRSTSRGHRKSDRWTS